LAGATVVGVVVVVHVLVASVVGLGGAGALGGAHVKVNKVKHTSVNAGGSLVLVSGGGVLGSAGLAGEAGHPGSSVGEDDTNDEDSQGNRAETTAVTHDEEFVLALDNEAAHDTNADGNKSAEDEDGTSSLLNPLSGVGGTTTGSPGVVAVQESDGTQEGNTGNEEQDGEVAENATLLFG